MIHFAWPFVFFLLPVPFILQHLPGQLGRENSAAIKVPFFAEIKTLSRKKGFFAPAGRQTTLLWGLWLLLLIAAARPQVPENLQNYTVPVRDIMLAVDISRSMIQQDMRQNGKSRLDAVKEAAAAFIARRQNDRIGIVLFSEQTNLYMPLTVDSHALNKMLSGVQPGLLGSLTAIGDALGLSLKYLENSKAQHKVIVLLTDGVNNAGNLAPRDALRAAEQQSVRIYTIGVGSANKRGTGVDVDFLNQAAERTNGKFFMVNDPLALDQAYLEISQNEPLSQASVYLIKQKELYFWPLLLFALIISGVVFKRAAERLFFRQRSG